MTARTKDKREEIMRAAEKLFTNRRFHEITLDEVARHASVGKGTIYLYFEDKDDLFFQVATSGFDELCAIAQRGVPAGLAFREGLLAVCQQISGFFQRRRQLFRMMQTEEGLVWWHHGKTRERWLERRGQLVAALGEILRSGVGGGEVQPEVPPEVLATFLLGMLRTRARELPQPEQISLEQVVDLFLRGVAGRTDGSGAAVAAPGESPG